MVKEWVIRDHFGDEITRLVAESGDDALNQAGDPADHYDAADEPIFGYWVAVCRATGETATRRWVIPAWEPDCTDGELSPHDWQEGQVWGNGGGLRWTDVCLQCGLRRTTDTWSTDPRDGGICTTTRYHR